MENHKKLFTAALITSIAAFIVSAMSLYFLYTITSRLTKLDEGASRLSAAIADLAETEQAQQVFILREFEGEIGIYSAAGVLTDVIKVQVSSLPEADQEMLKVGIYAYSQSELMSLIEDYTG